MYNKEKMFVQETILIFILFVSLCPCFCVYVESLKFDNKKDSKRFSIIYPKVRFKRSLQENAKDTNQDLQIQFNHESEEFAIYLRKNEHLVTSGTVVEWHYPNGTKQLSKLSEADYNKKKESNKKTTHYQSYNKGDNCLFIGEVIGRGGEAKENGVKSVAAIDVCDGGYRGYLQIGKDGYIIRPLKDHQTSFHSETRKHRVQYGNAKSSDNRQSSQYSNQNRFERYTNLGIYLVL